MMRSSRVALNRGRTLNRGRPSSPRAGFTLIEVLVALVIAALGLGALMAAAGQGLGNVSSADRFIEATRRAQTHLAMAGVTQAISVGEVSGDDGGGYVWRMTIQPVAARPPPKPDAQALALYTVAVTISWRDKNQTKSVSVASQRVLPSTGAHG